jgi:GTPase SAR1 family protein
MEMRAGLFIMDLFGGERRFQLPKAFLKNCSAWILCFDITREDSFGFVERYVADLLHELPNSASFTFV